jgi:hypothetical protein
VWTEFHLALHDIASMPRRAWEALKEEFFRARPTRREPDDWDWNWEPCGALPYDKKTDTIFVGRECRLK